MIDPFDDLRDHLVHARFCSQSSARTLCTARHGRSARAEVVLWDGQQRG